MDAAAELGRKSVSKHQIQPEYGDEQADVGRDCRTRLARPNSQARTRTEGNTVFLCSADHVQDWQPYPVGQYSCYMCDHIWTARPDSLICTVACNSDSVRKHWQHSRQNTVVRTQKHRLDADKFSMFSGGWTWP